MPQGCILCDGRVSSIRFSCSGRTYLRCSRCDLIFLPEEFHLSEADEIARYRLHENSILNEGYVGMFQEKIGHLQQYCPDITSVLDYGCGPEPVLAELMRKEGYDCDVYDRYFFPAFPEKSYDLVISTEVFEHLRDIKAELTRIFRLLNNKGFLAVMTSFHDHITELENWWYPGDTTHICFFSLRTFEWIGAHFRFEIVFTDRKNFIIFKVRQQ